MSARAAITLALIIIFLPRAADAQTQQQARALYDAGDFLASAAMAQSLGTSQGMSLSARSTLAHYAYVDRAAATPEIFTAANGLADQALKLDPRNVEAHLQAAVALGYRGRMTSPPQAHFAGYAKDARSHIQAALDLEPENPWAHAMLGAWNMEIVRKGGRFMARTMYGAKLDEGIRLYRRALELDPKNPVLQYEFGLALAAQESKKYAADATRQVQTALALPPKNAFERLAKARAQLLLNALNSGKNAEIRTVIIAQTEFPRAAKPASFPQKR